MTSAAMGSGPGQVGPYRLGAVLGRGATSIVYQARNEHGRPEDVALKLLQLDSLAENERDWALARFEREADLCRRMDHPNVVRVHDAGRHGIQPFLTMDLLDGIALSEVLRGPRLPPRRGVHITLQLLDALAHAHALGIVHRDVKPANIILGAQDRLTLVDFGIAHGQGSDLTLVGDMLGTPAWMAPEQISGAPVDHRADLFAAGIVLYALLTRQRAFTGTVAGVMQAILHRPVPPVTQHDPLLPAALDRTLERALAKSPSARFPAAAEFAAALRAVLPSLPETAAPGAAPEPEAAAPSGRDHTLRPMLGPRLARAHADAGRGLLTESEILWLERSAGDWTGANPALRQSLDPLMADWPASIVRLAETIVATAPVPEAQGPPRTDWLLLVRLAAVSLELLGRMGAADLAGAHRAQLAEDLSETFLAHLDRVGQTLARSETPDLDRLSMGLFRLDVLELGLEALGVDHEVRLAQKVRAMVAIQAMRRVNEAVIACTRQRDRIARFDVALIMAELEALISIAGRLTDPAGPPLGRHLSGIAAEVMASFIAGAGDLARLTANELRTPGATSDLRVFAAKLRQLGALHRFARGLPGQQHRAAVRRLADTMHAEVATLARGLMEGAADEPALSAIHDLAEGLGWHGLCAEIIRHSQRRAVSGGHGGTPPAPGR